MKQFKLFATIMVALLLASSCGDKNDPVEEVKTPLLNLKGDAGYVSQDVTIENGETITIGVIARSNEISKEKLKNFKMTFISNNETNVLVDTVLDTKIFDQDFDITISGVVDFANLNMELVDKAGLRAIKTIKITVKPDVVETPVTKSNITLGSSNESAVGSFYSVEKGQVYKVGEATSNAQFIDLVFFKGATNLNSITCPINSEAQTMYPKIKEWGVKNTTTFYDVAMTAAEFDAIGDVCVFPSFDPTQGVNIKNKLTNGNIYLFKTQSGKTGLIKVNNLYTRGDRADFTLIVEK